MGGNTRGNNTLTDIVDVANVKDLRGTYRIQRLYIVKQDFNKKELVAKLSKLKELDLVIEV